MHVFAPHLFRKTLRFFAAAFLSKPKLRTKKGFRPFRPESFALRSLGNACAAVRLDAQRLLIIGGSDDASELDSTEVLDLERPGAERSSGVRPWRLGRGRDPLVLQSEHSKIYIYITGICRYYRANHVDERYVFFAHCSGLVFARLVF